VTFLIGHDEDKFEIHKCFACYHSPVLDRAFASSFIEGQTQTYRLEDTTSAAFGIVTHWLYSQTLHYEVGWSISDELLELANVWILADKLLIPRLQNDAIDRISALLEMSSDSDEALPYLKYIYDNAPPDGPLCRMAIARWNQHIGTVAFDDGNPNSLPPRLLYDLAHYMVCHVAECDGNFCLSDPDVECKNGFDARVRAFHVPT